MKSIGSRSLILFVVIVVVKLQAADSIFRLALSCSFAFPKRNPASSRVLVASKLTLETKYTFLTRRPTRLFLQKNSTDSNSASHGTVYSFFQIDDIGLLTSDLLAIAIASQLMGLLDIVNDPSFIANGGWTQPIPAIPSTLGTLIQRFATLSVLWIIAALNRRDTYTAKSIETDEAAIKNAVQIWITFCLVGIILAVTVSFIAQSDLDASTILREAYIVGLSVPTFRFLYGRYFR